MSLKSLVERVTLALPRRRVFFIYTHNAGKDRFKFGLNANTEISYWSLQALKKAFPSVVFLKINSEKPYRINSIGPQDVVIGHVGETFLKASARTKRLIAFYPWAGHTDRSTNTLFNCIPFDEEARHWDCAASCILLTSEYNERVFINTPENFWYDHIQRFKKEKRLTTVHQPIDLNVFKRIKWDYLTSDFLYIGNNAHMKCLSDSKKLVEALARKLTLYGSEGKKLNHLDSNEVAKLPGSADFFIQPGMWEGQCVSILESAARGFIPVVSLETGYPYDHPYLLRYGDFKYNLDVLKALLTLKPDEKKQLADILHKQLVSDSNHNCWQKMTDVLVDEVNRLRGVL